MPKRERFKPISGTASRVTAPHERVLVAAADAFAWTLAAMGRAFGQAPRPPARDEIKQVLVLRLDRIGDVLMSLPALHDLRAALPEARVSLVVGAWSEEVARGAPVDEILTWSPPWAARPGEPRANLGALMAEARSLAKRPDLAIDLQGDLRAVWLMWLTGARWRVGYANTGGARLLQQVVPLDERSSWVEQNRAAVAAALGPIDAQPARSPLSEEDRREAERLIGELGLAGKRPLVGVHPSGGRLIKQWPIERWALVAEQLATRFDATFVITGSAADKPLAATIANRLGARAIDATGRWTTRQTLAVVGDLDLFLSPDTGPMHMACAVGTASVSVFGPSDPVRYFSGGDGLTGGRHVVVRPDLWCAPCNLIRSPPRECREASVPECLDGVAAETVTEEATKLLAAGGFVRRGSR